MVDVLLLCCVGALQASSPSSTLFRDLVPQAEGLRTTTNSRQEEPRLRPVVKNTLETRGASFLFSCWERPSVTDTPVTSLKLQAGNLKHGDRCRVPARLREPEHLSTDSVFASSP